MHKYLFIFGTKLELYSILNVFSFFPLLIFNLCHCRQKKENMSALSERVLAACQKNLRINTRFRFLKSKLFWTMIETVILSCLQFFPLLILTSVFASAFNTGSNYFGYLYVIPFILHIVYWLIGLDPFKQSNLTTPAFALSLLVAKLACFCSGCCRGIESTVFGMYNHTSQRTEVPVQLIEAAWAVLLFVFCMLWRKKEKPGTLLPLYTILYSATRFCSEFLRNEANIIGPLKKYHIFCLVGIAFGVIQYVIVSRCGEQLRTFIANGLPAIISNRKTKKKKKKKKKKNNIKTKK